VGVAPPPSSEYPKSRIDSGAGSAYGGCVGAVLAKGPLGLAVATAATLATLIVASASWADASNRNVQILDACDPETFNAALGEGTCVRKGGGVTIDRFVDQLIAKGEAPAWRFSPEHLKLNAGGTVTAANRGGEFHTFTEVAAFGGGCVPDINELLGLEAVPECSIPDIFPTTGVPPGASVTTQALAAGQHRFMCLIHPWQRTTVESR
jgi:plastocyanin